MRYSYWGKFSAYQKGWHVVDGMGGVKGAIVASYTYEIEAYDAAMLMNALDGGKS